MSIALVVAASDNDVIGAAGDLPWHIAEDLRRFKAITYGHAIIVGSRTQDSIVRRLGRPLPGRATIVVSHRQHSGQLGVTYARSLEEACCRGEAHRVRAGQREFFVAGGAVVYGQTLPLAARIYLTRVHEISVGDAVLPSQWLRGFVLRVQKGPIVSASGIRYSFCKYSRIPH
jgi:dihydrofolate reductase